MKFACLAALSAALITGTAAHADTVFSEDFGGDTSNLNGTAPDVRPGSETWVSSDSQFRSNGDFLGGSSTDGGSATLAFTPEQGLVYTLDASVSLDNINTGNWLGFGFADGRPRLRVRVPAS